MAKKKEEPIVAGPKQQLSFTLSNGVKERFIKYCDDNLLNKSLVLEKMIKDFFEHMDFGDMKKLQ